MMGFLNPWLLLGVLGVSVPIAIHLLNRFRPKRVEWGAMELLRKALVARSRQVRLEDLLLLLLRCLAVLLVAVALARPVVTAALGGMADGRAGAVIAIDASYSMLHQTVVQSRFDQAAAAARDIASTLQPGSPITLVLLSREPEILLRHTGFNAEQVDALFDDAAPAPTGLNLTASLEACADLMEQLDTATREVHLVTDTQQRDWQTLDDAARQAVQRIDRSGTLYLHPLDDTASENLAVTGLDRVSGLALRGGTVRYVAAVTNYGREVARNVQVQFERNGEAIDQQVIDRIEPGSTVRTPFFTRFEQPGSQRITVRLVGDHLSLDNRRHTVTQVLPQLAVLLVDGDRQPEPFASETDFLRQAWAAGWGRDDTVALQQIDALSFRGEALDQFHAVVLANVRDVDGVTLGRLRSFVETGGGLAIFPGDRTNPRVFNARFVGNQPLAPAQLGPLHENQGSDASTNEDQPPVHLMQDSIGHPLADVLATLPETLVQSVTLRQWYELLPVPGATVAANIDVPEANPMPLMVDHRIGLGHVMLWATAADRDGSDWVTHPLYLIMQRHALDLLTRQPAEGAVTIGQPFTISTFASLETIPVTLIGSDAAAQTFQVEPINGQVRIDPPSHTGFYDVELGRDARRLTFAVNLDARESDVTSIGRDALRGELGDLPVTLIEPGDDLAAQVRAARVGWELWWPLVLLALLVFVLESYLARRFSRRVSLGQSHDSATVDELTTAGDPTSRQAA